MGMDLFFVYITDIIQWNVGTIFHFLIIFKPHFDYLSDIHPTLDSASNPNVVDHPVIATDKSKQYSKLTQPWHMPHHTAYVNWQQFR